MATEIESSSKISRVIELLNSYAKVTPPGTTLQLAEVQRAFLTKYPDAINYGTVVDAYDKWLIYLEEEKAAGRKVPSNIPQFEGSNMPLIQKVEGILEEFFRGAPIEKYQRGIHLRQIARELQPEHSDIKLTPDTMSKAYRLLKAHQQQLRNNGQPAIFVPQLINNTNRDSNRAERILPLREELSNDEIAKQEGVKADWVSRLARRHGAESKVHTSPFTDEQKTQFATLWEQGMKWRDIYKAMGLDNETAIVLHADLVRNQRILPRREEDPILVERNEFIKSLFLTGMETKEIFAELQTKNYPALQYPSFVKIVEDIRKREIPEIRGHKELKAWREKRRQEFAESERIRLEAERIRQEQEEAARREQEAQRQIELQRKISELQSQLRGFMKYGGRIYFTSDLLIKEVKKGSIEVQARSSPSGKSNGPVSYEDVEDLRVIGGEPIVYKRLGNTQKGVRGQMVYNPSTKTKIYTLVGNMAKFSERGEQLLRILDQYRAETIIQLAGHDKDLLLEFDSRIPTILDIFQEAKAS